MYNGSTETLRLTERRAHLVGDTIPSPTTPSNLKSGMAMKEERPVPLNESTSFSSSRREVLFFNPAFATPSVTPGLTPSPGAQPQQSGVRRGPWVVSPPRPLTRHRSGQSTKVVSSSSRGLQFNLHGKGLWTTAAAFLLGAVLFFVALGVSTIGRSRLWYLERLFRAGYGQVSRP